MDQVQKLKARVDNRREERERSFKQTEAYRDRIKSITEVPKRMMMDFWCDDCQKDFTAIGFKETRELPGEYPIAWWTGFCPKGHKTLRRITHKGTDPYYYKSFNLRRQRELMADDLLTPDDPRFKYKYPAQWKAMQEAKDATEQHEQGIL